MKKPLLTLALVSALALTGCVGPQSEVDQPLVVATTTIVGDLVDQVGHGIVRLEVLMPIGIDTPRLPAVGRPDPRPARCSIDSSRAGLAWSRASSIPSLWPAPRAFPSSSWVTGSDRH